MLQSKRYNTKSLYLSKRLKKIFDGIFDYPLTVIEAPMGYGKTTAAREFVSKAGVAILWYRVYDNSIDNFWNGFVKLLHDLDESRCQGLLQLGFPADTSSRQQAITLIKGIKLPGKTVLVFDDYHITGNSSVNIFIEQIAESNIDNLHVILTARFVKFERLEELALTGCLYHIKKETFELKPHEIMAYYKTCGIILTYDEAQQLYTDTEGWISALYMFMLEYVASGSYTPAKSIYKLLEKTIYRTLSDEIKEFIGTMCIFDSFTIQQAGYMWEKGNADDILAELTGNNSFVTYDIRTKTYNIHSIFLGFLKEVLAEKGISIQHNLYQRAAKWYQENADYVTARYFYYKCGDFDGILSALEADRTGDYTITNKELLKKYMEECPAEVKSRHHHALLIFAMYLFTHKEFELFQRTCNEFRINIQKDIELDPDMQTRLLGEFELLLSFAEYNDLKKMSARQRKAWHLLQRPTSVYNTGSNLTFGSPSILSLYYRESGKLKEHVEDLKEALPFYHRLTNGHGSGAEYAMEAEYHFNQGNFDNAEICAQQALLKAQSSRDENIIFSAEYLQILIAFMKGDLTRVITLMDKMHQDMLNMEDDYFIHTVEVCEGCIYAYLNQLDKIPQRLLAADLSNPHLRFPAVSFFNVMYGRLFLVKKEYLKLIGSADYFFSVSSTSPNLLGRIYTYIYLAAAYRKVFREKDALISLKKALEIAMPDRQYMLFVENCDYIEPLLEKIAADGSYQKDIARILLLYKTFKNSKDQMIRAYFTVKKPKLTQREIEIARLAAAGMSNGEIGNQLFISANTVKKALESVYTKLSIHSRALLPQHLQDLDL